MGGFGSGGYWRWDKKQTCEASLRVDLRYMRAKGMLHVGGQGKLSWSLRGETTAWINYRVHEHSLELDYRVRSNGAANWTMVSEHVPLFRVIQPFGGSRLYMRCITCGRSCLVIYGGAYFRCRKCQRVAYSSQSEDAKSRLVAKAQKIRSRLRDSGTFDDPLPAKPKGMHWKTYKALIQRCEHYEDRIAAEMMLWMKKLGS